VEGHSQWWCRPLIKLPAREEEAPPFSPIEGVYMDSKQMEK
jgi:hypothetical protein